MARRHIYNGQAETGRGGKDLATQIRVPVTLELRERIWNLKKQNGDLTWRALQETISGWIWSYATLSDLAHGRQGLTNVAIYEALDLTPPAFSIIAGPGSIIVGNGQGLLSENQAVVFIVIPPEEWKRHSMRCEVCGTACPRWSSTQKYCEKHSWTTPEGRKFQREKRAALSHKGTL